MKSTAFPIISLKNVWFTISGFLVLASFVALFIFGLKPGIDFTGGSLLEVIFTNERPSIVKVQEVLAPFSLGTFVVQPSGEDKMILRSRFLTEAEHQTVLTAFRTSLGSTVIPPTTTTSAVIAGGDNLSGVIEARFETVGPSVSADLRQRSVGAILAVIIGMVAYIAYSFRKVSRPVQSWKFGVAAIVALIHDVGITAGVFAVLGRFQGIEVDVPFIVALLTVMGYSVNDTIVVFDRIRENLIKRGADNFSDTVNAAVNQTIARSVNTSLTTLLVLVAMYVFGGETIRYFSLALIIGIGVGTYSSIFLASPLLVVWEEWRRRV